ncbi:MAG: hypothetical protein BECKG1743F_GA0114225_101281 [Candidatus Kentron sp. G]|nr:MAG: hypothetical protein BECKG1743F_GA0114225_101281 [Candidatus Kentron sp. G]
MTFAYSPFFRKLAANREPFKDNLRKNSHNFPLSRHEPLRSCLKIRNLPRGARIVSCLRCGGSGKPKKRKVELQFALPQVENAPDDNRENHGKIEGKRGQMV